MDFLLNHPLVPLDDPDLILRLLDARRPLTVPFTTENENDAPYQRINHPSVERKLHAHVA